MASSADKPSGSVRRLVIVESPAKAKTIEQYLGPGYTVRASVGHIRDLPARASQIPAEDRARFAAFAGVDPEHNFELFYEVSPDKTALIRDLKAALKDADELLLATDEDREGEAISWHLIQALKPKVPYSRMVFNEITKEAITAAVHNTRELDVNLVDAQEARRTVDRLYGYGVSPVLWRKIGSDARSAGRVQSVALRLLVDRERERMRFVAAAFWDVTATCEPGAFSAQLRTLDGKDLARSSDFSDSGALTKDLLILDEAAAVSLVASLQGATLTVVDVQSRPEVRKPRAPFTTSTLQQDASSRLKWGPQRTMRVAQSLYESGWITYMRTDSTSLSETAMKAARNAVEQMFGANYANPRQYTNKVKNAQEAHEAIRPAGDVFRTPGEARSGLNQDQFLLYDLIWKRTVASQMADARLEATTARLQARTGDGRTAGFVANGSVYTFLGWKAALEDVADDEATKDSSKESEGSTKDRRLPPMKSGDAIAVSEIATAGHTTHPPRRYSQAALVGELEKRGIGRPSTYASIITLLENRGYAIRKGSSLVPTFVGIAIVQLLEQHFGELVDYDFTAAMEEQLDDVSNGQLTRLAALRRFYDGGDGFPGLKALLSTFGDIDARAVSSYRIGTSELFVRVGRYGAYVQRGDDGDRANLPPDIEPDQLTAQRAEEILAMPSGERDLGAHPETGLPVVVRSGRYGPYVEEVLPESDAPVKRGQTKAKPRRASLAMGLEMDSVELQDAVRLLNLPRLVGQQAGSGLDIRTNFGPSGPYVALMREPKPDYRSLEDPAQVFTLTLEQAENILAQPKVFRRGQAAAKPEVVVGTDPTTGYRILLKEGRFGPYVTDGVTNASLGRADDASTVSVERASDLLAERRMAEPSAKKAAPRRSAPRSASGKSTGTAVNKAASKRAPAKKTAAKKAAPKKPSAKTS